MVGTSLSILIRRELGLPGSLNCSWKKIITS